MSVKNQESWHRIPLPRAILEIVAARQEGTLESKLEATLKKEYGIEVSKSEIYRALVLLELQGLVYVEAAGREFIIRPTPQLYQSR
jgi:Fe2+ or Zn2+ uptake regulation protein